MILNLAFSVSGIVILLIRGADIASEDILKSTKKFIMAECIIMPLVESIYIVSYHLFLKNLRKKFASFTAASEFNRE